MNIAIIFAGGSGTRMNSKSRPKQFLLLNGKPIIIYTIEVFENHRDIDAVIVVCLEGWIPYLKSCLEKHGISKVVSVIPGGKSGADSIFLGLCEAERYARKKDDANPIVLIHDGVRPLIYEQTISDNIETVKKHGNCITVVPAIETILVTNRQQGIDIPPRQDCRLARAPQSFYLKDVIAAYRKAREENLPDFIDSCSLMNHFGYRLATIDGPLENIKITTPTDYYLFRAMVEVLENQQIFGIS